MLTPHVLELIDIVVAIHVKSGGEQADKMREILTQSHAIAYMDGQLEVINGLDAGIQTHQAIRRAAA